MCRETEGLHGTGQSTMTCVYGYVRVSIKEQNEDRQMVALTSPKGVFLFILVDCKLAICAV